MEIESITIYSRGKNRDANGNPYYAFKAVISRGGNHYDGIVVYRRMTYGDGDERDCLQYAINGINEAIGLNLKTNDPRIIHYHKRVTSYTALEHPENWRELE